MKMQSLGMVCLGSVGTQLSSNLAHFQSSLPTPACLGPFPPQSPTDQTFREQS